MKLGVAVGQYKYPIAAVQTCVNMYPERAENRALGDVILRSTPGLTSVGTLSGGGNGALYTFNDTLYAVSGGQLSKIASDGTVTTYGTVSGSGRISIADDGELMLIVVGGTVKFVEQYFLVSGTAVTNGYTFDGTTLAAMADPDFPLGDLGDQIFFSDLADGTAWQALSFFSAESNPDKIQGHVPSHGNLLVFGERSLEYWTPSGDPDLPFQKSQGSEQNRGCLAPGAIAQLDNTVFFLGDDRVVYKVLDFRPVRVSHHALEQDIEMADYDSTVAAKAFAYTQSGHFFYCLTFGETTWVYDATTSGLMQAPIWHRRSSDDSKWRVQWYEEAYGRKYGLDESGGVWTIDSTVYTEDDEAIYWEFTIGPFTKEAESVTCPRLTLICETGSTEDYTVDPQVECDVSRDLGRTWTYKSARSLGQTGEYRRTVTWRRNGSASATPGLTFRFHGERSYEFSVADVVADIHA